MNDNNYGFQRSRSKAWTFAYHLTAIVIAFALGWTVCKLVGSKPAATPAPPPTPAPSAAAVSVFQAKTDVCEEEWWVRAWSANLDSAADCKTPDRPVPPTPLSVVECERIEPTHVWDQCRFRCRDGEMSLESIRKNVGTARAEFFREFKGAAGDPCVDKYNGDAEIHRR